MAVRPGRVGDDFERAAGGGEFLALALDGAAQLAVALFEIGLPVTGDLEIPVAEAEVSGRASSRCCAGQ